MRSRSPISRAAQVALLAGVTLAAKGASASLIVAPPVLGPAMEPSRAAIEAAVFSTLKKGRIEPTEIGREDLVRLRTCGNKMGCLADAGDQVGAAHVLHVAIAQRGDKVQAQLTILATENAKPVQVLKLSSATGTAEVVTMIAGGIEKVVKVLRTLPEYSDESGGATPQETPAQAAAKRQPELILPSQPLTPTPPPAGGAAPTPAPPIASSPVPPPSRGDLPTMAATPGANPEPRFGGGEAFGEDRSPSSSAGSVETSAPPRKVKLGTNWVAIGVWGAGGATILGGGVAFVLSALDVQRRNSTPQLEIQKRQEIQDEAAGKQAAGAILCGVGAGIVGVGALLYWMGWGAPEEPLDVSASAGPGGASARVTMRW